MRTSELLGCALLSSGGGLKSICVSLLELCPSSGKVLASTLSDRGGERLGFRAGADFDCVCVFEGDGGFEVWAPSAAVQLTRTMASRLRMNLFYRYVWVERNASRQRRAVSSSGYRLPSCSIR